MTAPGALCTKLPAPTGEQGWRMGKCLFAYELASVARQKSRHILCLQSRVDAVSQQYKTNTGDSQTASDHNSFSYNETMGDETDSL